MDICVFGAGSLGSLVGGLLAREHEVTLVGRRPHVERVTDAGLVIIRDPGAKICVRPAASTSVPARADLAIVTVKSFDTPAAAESLRTVDLDAVLSLQNGMGNEARLAETISAPVLAGTCTYGAVLTDPGVVRWTGQGEIVLGDRAGGASAIAERVVAAVEAAGLSATASTAMPRELWTKLAVNAGINAATALARVPNGALVDGPGTWITRRAADEAAAVATEQGIDISPEATVETALTVAEQTRSNRSSMYQDVAAGTRTEIDAINGYVCDRADSPVPVNETLTRLVRSWERDRGLRD